MSKLIIKNVAVAFIFMFLSSLTLFANEINITTDNLEYDERSGKMNANDNVVIHWKDKKLNASRVEFDINGKTMYADDVFICFFNNSHKIFMRSKSIEKQGENIFIASDIKLSNCDLRDPHTSIRAKRGELVLDKKITIYNPVFYIGKVPIFYLPVVTKSLIGRGFFSNLDFGLKPKHSDKEGLQLETTLSFPLNDDFAGKVKYDYLGKRGNGYGVQVDYVTDKAKGNICAYTSKDLLGDDKKVGKYKQKWKLKENYFHKLNNMWTIRSKAEFINDRDFNNIYDKDDTDKTVNFLSSYLSITGQNHDISLNVDVRHNAKYNDIARDYKTSLIELPKIVLNCYPKSTFMEIIHKPTFQYKNFYKQHNLANNFYRQSSSLGDSFTKNFVLSKRLVLKTDLKANINCFNRDKIGAFSFASCMRYGGSLNARFRAASWMDWNIKYSYGIRTKQNHFFDTDNSANDYGIEMNDIDLSNSMYIKNTTIRNITKCKMLKNREHSFSKWSPFVTEIIWTPEKSVTLYARGSKSIETDRVNSCYFDTQIGEYDKLHFNFGIFYRNYDCKQDDNNCRINTVIGAGVLLKSKLRLGCTVKISSFGKSYEHEIKFSKSLHCYRFGLSAKITKRIGSSGYDKSTSGFISAVF